MLLLKGFLKVEALLTRFEFSVSIQLATSFSHDQQILPSLSPVLLSGCMVFPTLGLQFVSLECDFQIWMLFLWKYVHFHSISIDFNLEAVFLGSCTMHAFIVYASAVMYNLNSTCSLAIIAFVLCWTTTTKF